MSHGVAVTIRPVKAWREYLAAEELQRVVWQMPDWRDVVPGNLLITAHKSGGILLGAFDPAERMIGFVFSFLGTTEPRGNKILKHCSHMLAILPEFQGQKIGERLKFEQRQAALAQNIRLMTWTYDPLLALNGHLNLARLGAIARHYIVSAYGEMTDGLNAGLPSDRLEVEWWLDAPRVQARASAPPPRRDWDALLRSGIQPVFDITFDSRAVPRIARTRTVQGEKILLEIPANLNAVKAADAALALDWRMRARAMFQELFDAGFVAVDFVIQRAEPARAAYLLTHPPNDFGIAL